MARLLSAAEATVPTYPEQGATLAGDLPAGYHHVGGGALLGSGAEVFTRACGGLRSWRAHQLRGVRVFPADTPPEVGGTVVVTFGARIGAIAAPCRIVEVVEEPQRYGFAYGTLPGHPEQGEELFIVSIAEDDTVRFDIRAFSRPGDAFTRLAGPLGRGVQSLATKGYLRAISRFVAQPAPR
jgi:uncharacterized protein (UPF0548 family)